MATIPASQVVNVTPEIITAGGSPLVLNGLILSSSTRVPIGQVLSFPSALAVQNYFGGTSDEATAASVYFLGFDNSNVKPGSVLFAQYNASAVSAYIRGGSVAALTLPQLQAISGTLDITIDGYAFAATTFSLAAATSFSTAATLIQSALVTATPTEGTGTGSIGGTFATSTTTGTTLTMGALTTGSLQVGDVVSGTDGVNSLPAGTTVLAQLTGTPGGSAGATFTLSHAATPGNLGSATVTSLSTTLNLTAATANTFAVGQTISGAGISAGTIITSQISGTTGGVGLYGISAAYTVVSEAITAKATAPVVTYDSVSGGFVVTSGITGTPSTMGYATGTMSTAIKLTSATGAVLSQGAAATTPSAAMTAYAKVTQNWATFMTIFNPDVSGNTNKLAFAAWTNTQNKRYAYACWDTDITPTTSAAATSSLGYILTTTNSDGTVPIYAPVNTYKMAAFFCGAAASIDFTQTNGRITFDFKSQSGFTADVTDETVAANLVANGYNCYEAVATANQGFQFFYPGSVTGIFKWADSYINQIWLNNAFRLALMTLLTQAMSIPYDNLGYGLQRAALTDPITQAGTFGIYGPGIPLSALQAAEVNAAAGTQIDRTLSSQGYYLQILPATAQVRGQRASNPMTFWYMDAGSIQKMDLASVEVQ